MAKDINQLFGVTKEPIQTIDQREMLRKNLNTQREKIEAEIALLQGQLDAKKEYLAKIDGGLDVLDELGK